MCPLQRSLQSVRRVQVLVVFIASVDVEEQQMCEGRSFSGTHVKI